MQFYLFLTDQAVIWNLLGIGKRQNDSIMHQFKFPSYTITNLRTLVNRKFGNQWLLPPQSLVFSRK